MTTLNLDFTHEVIRAIESYTKRKKSASSNVFIYQGLNLQYAIERHLYIHCVNSPALLAFYSQVNSGEASKYPIYLSPIEADIALEFNGMTNLIIPTNATVNHSINEYFFMRWIKGHLKAFWQRLKFQNNLHNSTFKVDVLIGITQFKFVQYLNPITHQLSPLSYSYLLAGDSKAHHSMVASGEPYVGCTSKGLSFQALWVNKTLQNFYDILRAAQEYLVAIKKIDPRAVVVVEGNAPQDSIMKEVCRELRIPIFCIQQGWSPIVHNGFRNMSFDKMFVWGEGFAKILSQYNVNQKFVVAGSHITHPEDFQERRMESGENRRVSFFLQAPSSLISQNTYDDFIELILWCAHTYPRIIFAVRPHPNYAIPDPFLCRLKACSNVEFSIPGQDNLRELIKKSTLTVSIFSTVILESISMGVIPLICSIGSLKSYDMDLEGAAIEVTSISDAKEVIDAIINQTNYLDSYQKNIHLISHKYFAPITNSAELISDHIKNVIPTS